MTLRVYYSENGVRVSVDEGAAEAVHLPRDAESGIDSGTPCSCPSSCSICSESEVEGTCERCGQAACIDHLSACERCERRLCADCAECLSGLDGWICGPCAERLDPPTLPPRQLVALATQRALTVDEARAVDRALANAERDAGHVHALVRAAAAMSPDSRRRLRELAECMAGDEQLVDHAFTELVAEALATGGPT